MHQHGDILYSVINETNQLILQLEKNIYIHIERNTKLNNLKRQCRVINALPNHTKIQTTVKSNQSVYSKFGFITEHTLKIISIVSINGTIQLELGKMCKL